jgi:metal transporter CNNM
VIGLLFVKDLIFIDPEDDTRVADFIEIFGRGVHVLWPDDKLGDVLRELKRGRSHMAVVRDVNNEDDRDPFYEIKGIITLEDIIEEIIGDEIVDETDAFVDGTHKEKVDRAETFKWARLRLLDSKIVDETLSFDETRAVTAHLLKNYPDVVALVTENQLQRLISENHVQLLPTATHELGQPLPSDLLYEKGLPTDMCTLLLAGKVTVLAGIENFRSDVSSWCLLAPGALSNNSYSPDFTAFVSSGPVRCLRISRSRFDAAVDASAIEKNTGTSSRKLVEEPAEAVPDLTHPSEHAAQPSPEHDAHDSDNRKGRLLSALQMVGGKKRLSGRFVAPHGDESALASDAGSSSSRQDISMSRDELARSLRGSPSSRVIEYIGSPASQVTPDSEKGYNR